MSNNKHFYNKTNSYSSCTKKKDIYRMSQLEVATLKNSGGKHFLTNRPI